MEMENMESKQQTIRENYPELTAEHQTPDYGKSDAMIDEIYFNIRATICEAKEFFLKFFKVA